MSQISLSKYTKNINSKTIKIVEIVNVIKREPCIIKTKKSLVNPKLGENPTTFLLGEILLQ